jgi:hypothetical protein
VASFRVSQAWHDRLVFEFIHNLGYLRGTSGLGSSLLDLLRSVGLHPRRGLPLPPPRTEAPCAEDLTGAAIVGSRIPHDQDLPARVPADEPCDCRTTPICSPLPND